MSETVKGSEKLIENLKKLGGQKLVDRAVRTALRAGAQVVRKSAVANAKKFDDSKSEEEIYKNVAIKNTKKAKVRVGVLGGAKKDSDKTGELAGEGKDNPGGDTWYWRFLEFGVPAHGIPAKPFLRNAAQGKEGEIHQATLKKLKEFLEKEMLK